MLKDVLPVDDKLCPRTVRNHLLRVAEREEATLGEEQVFFIEGCPRDWGNLPRPDGPVAHLLIQTRTWVLNSELSSRFRKWHPNLGIVDGELKIAA